MHYDGGSGDREKNAAIGTVCTMMEALGTGSVRKPCEVVFQEDLPGIFRIDRRCYLYVVYVHMTFQ